MKTRVDEKGKYFTEVISKTPVPVLIQTTKQRIRGTIHVHPDHHRLLDELNSAGLFVAVTDAQVIEGDSDLRSAFVAIRVDQIVWAVPQEEISGGEHV